MLSGGCGDFWNKNALKSGPKEKSTNKGAILFN